MSSVLHTRRLAWRTTASLVVLTMLTTACAWFDFGASSECKHMVVFGTQPETDPGGEMIGVERVRVLVTVDISDAAARSRFGPWITSTASLEFVAWPLVPGDPYLADTSGIIASTMLEGDAGTMASPSYRVTLLAALADCPVSDACHREFVATFTVRADSLPRTLQWAVGMRADAPEEVCSPVLAGEVMISATLIDRVGGIPAGDAGVDGG